MPAIGQVLLGDTPEDEGTPDPGSGTGPYDKFGGWEAAVADSPLVPADCEPQTTTRCLIAGTVTAARLLSKETTTATVEVWKVAGGAGPPTVANKISASAPITLTAAKESVDITLTGWSGLTVAVGDIFGFRLLTNSGASRLTASLDITP